MKDIIIKKGEIFRIPSGDIDDNHPLLDCIKREKLSEKHIKNHPAVLQMIKSDSGSEKYMFQRTWSSSWNSRLDDFGIRKLGDTIQIIKLKNITVEEGGELIIDGCETRELVADKIHVEGVITSYGAFSISCNEISGGPGGGVGGAYGDGKGIIAGKGRDGKDGDDSSQKLPEDHHNDPLPETPGQASRGIDAGLFSGPATEGRPGSRGNPGKPGGNGVPGINATAGDPGLSISILVKVLGPNLVITANGGRGGNGGNGGRGGNGGAGGQGGRGGDGGNGATSRCNKNGGAGGQGGIGGDAGRGGAAGYGRDGGPGGTVYLKYVVDNSMGTSTIIANGGAPGIAGIPGEPGSPGPGGPGGEGGNPGSGSHHAPGCPEAKTGDKGPDGDPGRPNIRGEAGGNGILGSEGQIFIEQVNSF